MLNVGIAVKAVSVKTQGTRHWERLRKTWCDADTKSFGLYHEGAPDKIDWQVRIKWATG